MRDLTRRCRTAEPLISSDLFLLPARWPCPAILVVGMVPSVQSWLRVHLHNVNKSKSVVSVQLCFHDLVLFQNSRSVILCALWTASRVIHVEFVEVVHCTGVNSSGLCQCDKKNVQCSKFYYTRQPMSPVDATNLILFVWCKQVAIKKLQCQTQIASWHASKCMLLSNVRVWFSDFDDFQECLEK